MADQKKTNKYAKQDPRSKLTAHSCAKPVKTGSSFWTPKNKSLLR